MCVKMEAQGATMEPQGHPKCQRDTTRPCKVPQRPKRHIQTARGRVLAEGDVDPAAGRGTTHQAACRSPRSGAEAENRGTSTQRLCSGSQITGCRLWRRPSKNHTILGPGVTPKHVKKTLKKQRAPMEAQRLKTRGPNPNPTTQAQSKQCFPLFTET